ncbi:MAG: lipoprotein [Gammaproteobacteria bacterium]|jgi:predicted small lipoprotein YifL|nr:lipoprotein [Gammaproteobacteria bacterium]MDH3906909.1 lipoprotein [Gammaproteobacteria bacterium]
MNRLILALAALTIVFIASGCGQSGPLYIPDNPSTISVPPPASDSTAEEAEEEEDDPQKD